MGDDSSLACCVMPWWLRGGRVVAAGDLGGREHGAAAGCGAAVAILAGVVRVVEVVFVGELFAGGDIAQGND